MCAADIKLCAPICMHHEDINECRANNGGCSQLCENIAGSYRCSCYDGYVINAQTHECNGERYNDSLPTLQRMRTDVFIFKRSTTQFIF